MAGWRRVVELAMTCEEIERLTACAHVIESRRPRAIKVQRASHLPVPNGRRSTARPSGKGYCQRGQEEIKPHKVRYYLERRDAEFEQKMAEVLGPGSEESRRQVAQSHQRQLDAIELSSLDPQGRVSRGATVAPAAGGNSDGDRTRCRCCSELALTTSILTTSNLTTHGPPSLQDQRIYGAHRAPATAPRMDPATSGFPASQHRLEVVW